MPAELINMLAAQGPLVALLGFIAWQMWKRDEARYQERTKRNESRDKEFLAALDRNTAAWARVEAKIGNGINQPSQVDVKAVSSG